MGDNTPKKTPLKPAWAKGQSGNPKGRPKGSRNKLGEAFLADMHDKWLEHGSDVIQRVIDDKPEVFLKVVASLIPKELKVSNDVRDMTEEEIIAELRELHKTVGHLFEDPETTQH